MKKTVFSLLATLAVLPVWFSCTEKELDIPVLDVPSTEAVYEYRLEISDGDTRATLGEDGVYWQNGDQVGLFVKKGNSPSEYVNAHVSVQDGSTPAVVFTTHNALDETANIYAYYSSPLQSSTSEGAAQIVFPDVQQGGSTSAMPLAGIPTQFLQGESNGVVHFLNLGSVIDFRVYSYLHEGARIQSIKLEASNGFVAGSAVLDLNTVSGADETFPNLSWTGGKTSVTLTQGATVAGNKDAAAQNHLYMVVAPGAFSGTITVVTNEATYSFPFNTTFKRNAVKRLNLSLESGSLTRNSEYVKVQNASELVNGGTYLIVHESSSKVFHPVLNDNKDGYLTSQNAESVTISSDKRISVTSGTPLDASRVILEKVQNTSSDYYIKVPSADYRYLYLSSSSIKVGSTATTISVNSGIVSFKRSSGYSSYYLSYNTSGNGAFTIVNKTSSTTNLALYKPVNGGLETQSLQFNPSTVRISMAGQTVPFALSGITTLPALTGVSTSVAGYSSSDPEVATVDASGTVTVVGAGKTVISATAVADASHLEGFASYTLTVLADGVYSIENDRLAAYLDKVEAHPYNPPYDYAMTYMTSDLYNGNTTNRYDWPKPVPVSWSNPSAGNTTKTVKVYNCTIADGEVVVGDPELSVFVSSVSATSADVYNLIPNRDYYYEVVNGTDSEPFAEGTFRTTGRRRMIKVGSDYGQGYANNCRDFGGQVTADGTKRVKYGRIFRGSNMDLIFPTNDRNGNNHPEARDVLKSYLNVGLDVDLRSGSGTEGEGKNRLFNALSLNGDWHTTQTFNSWDDLSNTTKIKTILLKVFEAVAPDQGNRNVYIHCMVGADRTGYVCMLIEAILGVSQGWCDVDYELTSFSGAVDSGSPRLRTGQPVNHYYRTKGSTVQGVDFLYLQSLGNYVQTFNGNEFQAKAVNYVVNTLGIPYATVQAFQNNMLEENN